MYSSYMMAHAFEYFMWLASYIYPKYIWKDNYNIH